MLEYWNNGILKIKELRNCFCQTWLLLFAYLIAGGLTARFAKGAKYAKKIMFVGLAPNTKTTLKKLAIWRRRTSIVRFLYFIPCRLAVALLNCNPNLLIVAIVFQLNHVLPALLIMMSGMMSSEERLMSDDEQRLGVAAICSKHWL